jgi:hypothetical protein
LERNAEAEKERLNLAKKLAMTCRSDDLDKELGTTNNKALPKEQTMDQDIEQELIQDEFFQEYLKKKLDEMQKNAVNL